MSAPLERDAPDWTPSWRRWIFGVLIVAGVAATVLHFSDLEHFAALARQAKPGWLILAMLLQLATYAAVAAGWSAVLRHAGTPLPLPRLMRIAITKLFADQALPSAGLGGDVLLVAQLRSVGVPRGVAAAALLTSMIGFYAAYALFAIIMLVLLWLHARATPLMAGLVTLFLAIAIAIPALALWLRRRGSAPLPAAIARIGLIRSLLDTMAQAPAALLKDRQLLARVGVCNSLVFLADAGTLFVCILALGQPISFGTAFIAFIMASIVVTLGPVPLGLGTFEATSTATLHLLGIPLETAFTGTMLLRALTLWLPMLPGFFLIHGAFRPRSHPP